jgi:Helix-turn-helix domain
VKKSQTQFVLDHLIDHGYITEVIARNYGVKRLASRMHELKRADVLFKTETREDDFGNRYAYYWLPTGTREYERERRDRALLDWRGEDLKAA